MNNRNDIGQFISTNNNKFHKGYKVIYFPTHPHSRQNGYVYEHILVMEKELKRNLEPNEVVHHIDGNKLNNSPENLMLFPNNIEHMKYHWKSKTEKYCLKSGELVTINQLSERTGLSYMTVYQRIKKLGWSADEVVAGCRIAEEIRNNG